MLAKDVLSCGFLAYLLHRLQWSWCWHQVESGCEKLAQSAATQTLGMWIVTWPLASRYNMFR
jgi:hypothetical protein